jgi:hypothetical protein
MKKIEKDELFSHIRQFLKAKGIELQEGSYTRTIEKSCQVLADTINLSQQAVVRAKAELDRTLDHARRVIHEKTAPRKPPVQAQPQPEPQPQLEPEPALASDAAEEKGPPKARPARSKRKKTASQTKSRKRQMGDVC